MRSRDAVSATLALLLVLALAAPAFAAPRSRRMSVRSNGTERMGDSGYPDINPSGRFVAFSSYAQLVPADTNTNLDVYLRDQRTRKTRWISMRADGSAAPSGGSEYASVSGDGRFVAFESTSALVGADTLPQADIYLRDRKTRRTRLMSLRSNGTQGDSASHFPAISADGRFIAFETQSQLVGVDTNGLTDIYVRDRTRRRTRLVSTSSGGQIGNGVSLQPAISADGRFIAFESNASNLVPGDGNLVRDVFVKDMATGRTRRMSVRSNETEGPGGSGGAAISANGRWVAFTSDSPLAGPDTDPQRDVFVRDRRKGRTRQASVSSAGADGNCASTASIDGLDISPDGRWVAFDSCADNLGNPMGNYSVYLHDLLRRKTRLLSRRNGGAVSPGTNEYPAISKDGRFVAWASDDEMIVGGDANASYDIFRWGPRR